MIIHNSPKKMTHNVKYNWEFNKEDILQKIYKNKSLLKQPNGNTSQNTDELMFCCKEFDSIKNFVVNQYFKLKKTEHVDYAVSMWSYIQTKDLPPSNYIWHTHSKLDGGRTQLKTDYTFVFYVQIPPNLENGEGDLLIKDNNDSIHTITPKEGDIIFFSGYLWHVPTHTPTATIDRVVIAGNITSEFLLNTVLI